VNLDVAQGDIIDGDEVVRLTRRKWVQKATWTCITTMCGRLLLLLGSDVDRPPDRREYFQVIVQDV